MVFHVENNDNITYDGQGNVIAVNDKKIAKGAGPKTNVRDRIMKEIKRTLSESKFYSSDIQEGEKFFLRSPSNDYLIEITGKKDQDTKRAVMIAAGGAVTEYAAGLLRLSLTATKNIPECEVLWAEGSKLRIHLASGDYEVRVVKKRDRICG